MSTLPLAFAVWAACAMDPEATAETESPPLPDLTVDRDTLATDLSIESRRFTESSCAVSGVDRCVGGTGERKLLRFSVATANLGTADLVLGDPAESSADFQFSDCHGHYHLANYATYELVASDGRTVAAGHKQAFCLMDTIPLVEPNAAPEFDCANQGLQRGWADLYDASLPCQWIDVTGLPDGDYELVVGVNPGELFDELDMSNNEQRLPVRLGADDLTRPTEDCDPSLNPAALAGETRECGWVRSAEWSCVPGSFFQAGCAPACGDPDSCVGRPMLRVCDATLDNCTTGASLGSATEGCGALCPNAEALECPPSGLVVAYTSSLFDGDAYRCDVTFQYM